VRVRIPEGVEEEPALRWRKRWVAQKLAEAVTPQPCPPEVKGMQQPLNPVELGVNWQAGDQVA
jgi:hypothetical protein